MGTLTINGEDFEVFGTSAGLASRANGSSTYYEAYTAAVAADPDDVMRKHHEATDLIALLPFSDPANAVPATAAADVATACYELVLAALIDDAVLTQDSTGSNVKSVYAKGVELEFFAPVGGARFPVRVMVLLGPLLGASPSSDAIEGGCFAAGVDECSDFDARDSYGLTRG